jgi:hypothetical protein
VNADDGQIDDELILYMPDPDDLQRFERNGEGGNRTHDTTIFSRVLYQLSYLAVAGAVLGRAAEG